MMKKIENIIKIVSLILITASMISITISLINISKYSWSKLSSINIKEPLLMVSIFFIKFELFNTVDSFTFCLYEYFLYW